MIVFYDFLQPFHAFAFLFLAQSSTSGKFFSSRLSVLSKWKQFLHYKAWWSLTVNSTFVLIDFDELLLCAILNATESKEEIAPVERWKKRKLIMKKLHLRKSLDKNYVRSWKNYPRTFMMWIKMIRKLEKIFQSSSLILNLIFKKKLLGQG